MARYLGPKVKLSRRVGVPIADIPKHTSKRQLNPRDSTVSVVVVPRTTASARMRSRSFAITTT